MTIGLGFRPSQVPIRSRPIRQPRFSSRTSPESPIQVAIQSRGTAVTAEDLNTLSMTKL